MMDINILQAINIVIITESNVFVKRRFLVFHQRANKLHFSFAEKKRTE